MKPLAQYQSIQTSTTDRGGLLLYLYDGIIREIRKARKLMHTSPENSGLATLKAQMGIVELDKTLNFEAGPELAESLHSIYLHILFILAEAMEDGVEEGYTRAEKLVRDLRDTWAEAIGTQRRKKAG